MCSSDLSRELQTALSEHEREIRYLESDREALRKEREELTVDLEHATGRESDESKVTYDALQSDLASMRSEKDATLIKLQEALKQREVLQAELEQTRESHSDGDQESIEKLTLEKSSLIFEAESSETKRKLADSLWALALARGAILEKSLRDALANDHEVETLMTKRRASDSRWARALARVAVLEKSIRDVQEQVNQALEESNESLEQSQSRAEFEADELRSLLTSSTYDLEILRKEHEKGQGDLKHLLLSIQECPNWLLCRPT